MKNKCLRKDLKECSELLLRMFTWSSCQRWRTSQHRLARCSHSFAAVLSWVHWDWVVCSLISTAATPSTDLAPEPESKPLPQWHVPMFTCTQHLRCS